MKLLLIIIGLLSSLSSFGAASYTCDSKYDVLDVPRVETTSMEGYYYCFGLHHGKDRAWQMDYFRRVVQGRNAEVLGREHIKNDLIMRMLELSKFAERLYETFPEQTKQYFEAYALGANEGFKTGKNAKEFNDNGFTPEPWKPSDSLSILLLQSFDQTRKSFIRDINEQEYKETWGDQAQELFDEDLLPWQTNILKDGEYLKKTPPKSVRAVLKERIKLWAQFPSVFGLESGSNNWVVSKNLSKTKKAILANDPHLDLKTPLFWYWIGIKTPQVKVLGGSVPGVPVIATGTNGKVSWGLTNSYLNAADAIAIKDLTDDQIETIRPTVMVKFWFFKFPFFFKTFQRLRSGHPILPLETSIEHKIALRWTGFSLKAEDIVPMFEIQKSENVSDIDSKFAKIGVPSWNFVFADTKGDIGYRLVGRTYKQENKNAMGIPVMTREEFLNEEYLDDNEEPQILKPKRDYVVSANNRHWPLDSQYYGGRAYSASFRALKIEELLMKDKQDAQSSKDIQCDREVMDARYFLPKIQKYLRLSQYDRWDRSSEDRSTLLPLYRRLFDLMLKKWNVNEYALFHLMDDLNPAQVEELKELHKIAEQETKNKTWGNFHVLKFPHLSRNPDWIYSPEISGVGDTFSVDPGTSVWNEERMLYEQTSGASMRMVIEMEEVPKIHLVLPGPNRNYTDSRTESPWLDWKNCKYTEIKF